MGENIRKIWITVILLLLGVSVYIYSAFRPSAEAIQINAESQLNVEDSSSEIKDDLNEPLISDPSGGSFPVYLCGQIREPGIYQLETSIYLYQLIELAGGLTEQADQNHINMVYEINESQSIYIPSVDDDYDGISTEIMQDSHSERYVNGSGASKQFPININEANVDELCLLPGIGSKTAEKIINYRTAQGPFASIDQIKNVSGIGDAKYEQIREYIYV